MSFQSDSHKNRLKMEDCLSMDNFNRFPKPKVMPEVFIPRNQQMTARETKLVSLYGTSFIADRPVESLPEYPLAKMTGSPCNRRLPRDKASDLTREQYAKPESLSAKEIKQFYDMRSRTGLPFETSRGAPTGGRASSNLLFQEDHNRRLHDLRVRQPCFSDIFGVSSLDSIPVSATPNRSLRVVRGELNPHGSSNEVLSESARERYLRGLKQSDDALMNDGVTRTECRKAESREAAKNSDGKEEHSSFFSSDFFAKPKVAKVWMMKLRRIPNAINEKGLVEGIRGCRCYVTKLWMPTDVLLGKHKGVAALIVRSSAEIKCGEETAEHESDTSSSSAAATTTTDLALDVLTPLEAITTSASSDKLFDDEDHRFTKKEEGSFIGDMSAPHCTDGDDEFLTRLISWLKAMGIEGEVTELMTEH